MSRVMTRIRMRIGRGTIRRRRNLRGRSVLISCVTPKRFIRNSGLKCNMLNTGFCAAHVTKTTATTTSVSFANRSTPALVMPMMMISGLGVMSVIGGYVFL